MTLEFAHDHLPQRVRFAPGRVRDAVEEELDALGVRRPMVIVAGRGAEPAAAVADRYPRSVVFQEAARHVPADLVARARAVAAGHRADAFLCIGGGSVTGLAKAVARYHDAPVVAVPTTYAGSEATDVWGVTENGVKTTGRDRRVLPRVVVYDADLYLGMPAALAASSGLNAIAHAVDAMWAPSSDPFDRALAGEGIRDIARGLPSVVERTDEFAGHERVLLGAYASARAFAGAGSGLHHTICHVLGGMFDLPHAETHTVVLQHVLDLNVPNAPGAGRRIADALGAADPRAAVRDLRARLGVPSTLRELGMPHAGIRRAVDPILAAVPPGNPTPVTAENLTALLRSAWSGGEPSDGA